jgi:hypothetical protein
MLPLWDEPRPAVRQQTHRERIVADSTDRVAWLKARARGVTATDVARLTSERAVKSLAMEKLLGSRFGGNAFTAHGILREPMIGRWAGHVYGMRTSPPPTACGRSTATSSCARSRPRRTPGEASRAITFARSGGSSTS